MHYTFLNLSQKPYLYKTFKIRNLKYSSNSFPSGPVCSQFVVCWHSAISYVFCPRSTLPPHPCLVQSFISDLAQNTKQNETKSCSWLDTISSVSCSRPRLCINISDIMTWVLHIWGDFFQLFQFKGVIIQTPPPHKSMKKVIKILPKIWFTGIGCIPKHTRLPTSCKKFLQ